MRHGPAVLLLVLGAAVALVGGCLARSAGPGSHDRHASHPPAADAVLPATAAGFNATDTAWLQLMIAMEERALLLLDLGAGRGGSPAVRGLAGRLRQAHAAELRRLRAELGRTGLPARNPHEGHDMPGMATPDELAALGAATGGAFDRLFLTRLREHVEQTALVSRSEQVSGADRATRDLAAAIVRSRTAERDLLTEIEIRRERV
ncbi:DUF305 domain-containing protein [Nonomuraea sp. NPDC049625]|uniref:DUF305 domain-containing protein n=1 Tax=Nonomuraea sp. NPDC049625 TaxID=3155775 RepID=UPI0034214C06